MSFECNTDMKDMLLKAKYVVEANSFESYTCYVLYSKDSDVPYHTKINYKQGCSGYAPIIGYINERPICLSFFLNYIDNVPVLFYNGCSQLVDYKMIEDWLTKYCPAFSERNSCDMNNFHQCIHFVDKLNNLPN